MSDRTVYLDSSAIIKLIVEEPETLALEEFLAGWPSRMSSVLAQTEVLRVARTFTDTTIVSHARDVLARIHLIRPDDAVLRAAADIEPLELKTLDAIHLATAISLGPDLGGMVTYDRRLARAARVAGLTVWAPA